MQQTEEPPHSTERRAGRTGAASRRSQVRRRTAASTAAVVILLVFGVSLLIIVVAQAALGFDPFGLGHSAPAERPTVVVAGATALPPTLPTLVVQPAEVALPDGGGGRPLVAEPALATLVQQQLGSQRAVVGVAIKNLDNGQGALVNADREFSSGSVGALLVAYEAYRQRDTGRITFADPLTITEQVARLSGGPPEAPVGSTVSVGWAVDRLLTRGDPSMIALLLDRLGVLNLNNTLSDLGLQESRASADRVTTSPRDLLLVLERLVRGQGLSAASNTELLQYLADVRPGDRLATVLPRGTVLLHRNVNGEGLVHEVGVIYSPAATLVMVELASDVANGNATAQAETSLARAVYDYFNTTAAGTALPRSQYQAPPLGPRPTPPPARLPSGNIAPAPPTLPLQTVEPLPPAPLVTSAPLPAAPPAVPGQFPAAPTAVIPSLRPTEPVLAPPFATAVRPTAAPPFVAPTAAAPALAPPAVTAVRPTVAAPVAPPAAPPAVAPAQPPLAVPTVSAPPPTVPARGPLPPTLGPAPAQNPANAPAPQAPAAPAAPAPTAPRPEAPRFGQ